MTPAIRKRVTLHRVGAFARAIFTHVSLVCMRLLGEAVQRASNPGFAKMVVNLNTVGGSHGPRHLHLPC